MSNDKPCADCRTNNGELEIRKRFLCRDCFTRYVGTKALKRMESYRFSNLVGEQRPKLLLPLSGGLSSLALLHVLDSQLHRLRNSRSRIAYDLILLHVHDLHMSESEHSQWRENIAVEFPSHTFLPTLSLYEVFKGDPKMEEALQHTGIHRQTGETDETFLLRIFTKVKTPTARADLREILLQRLIVSTALEQGCYGIVWGHSDSRLAAMTLAAVAKGRGAAVPGAIANGLSPYRIVFNYPLRDLFRTELKLYLDSTMTDLRKFTYAEQNEDETPVSIKQTSIDELLNTYITSQGEKYPSIMANVVRTAGKLQVSTDQSRQCILCRMPRQSATKTMCYGCERMKQDIIVD